MKRVAVIGSNCFSASDFIDLLLELGGYDVLGISRSQEKSALFLPYKRHNSPHFHFQQINLVTEKQKLKEHLTAFAPDYVINFAAHSEVATSWKHPDHYFRTNAEATASLCDVLKDLKIQKYCHISTPEVYGTCEGRVTESAPFNPSTPYAASKAAADLAIQSYVKHYQLPAVLVRATNVYGAHQQLYRIIPRTAIFVKMGKKIPLHGGGKAVKSFIHIRDISKGELAILERGEVGQTYHLSPDGAVSVADIVAKTCSLMNVDFRDCVEMVGERLGQDAAYVIDSEKARKELGWAPSISIDEGIEGIINWVNSNWNEIQQEPLAYNHEE